MSEVLEIKEGYKDSPLGEIPDSWEVRSLGECSNLMTNGFVGTATSHYTEEDDGVTYIQGYNVKPFGFNMHGIKKVNRQFHFKQSKSILEEGDILTVQTGHVGVAVVVPKELEGSNCHALIITRPKKDIVHSFFLSYFINSSIGKAQSKRIEVGTTMKHINVSDFLKYSIPLPPLPEQQKIAEILSTVDEKIEVIAERIVQTLELKKGLMQRLFTKGVGHTKFKDSPLGEIPESWKVVKLGDLKNNGVLSGVQDGNHGESHPVLADFVNEGIPFIMANCITKTNKLNLKKAKCISQNQYESLRIGFAKPNDVLLTHKGTVGLTAIIKEHHGNLMLTPQVTYYRVAKSSILSNIFLYYAFQSPVFQSNLDKFSKQSTRAYIGITAQLKLYLALPLSIVEQQKIADILSSVDDKIDSLKEKKEEFQVLKKGLMQQLLTGKMRVNI